jgi:hypothetical protein
MSRIQDRLWNATLFAACVAVACSAYADRIVYVDCTGAVRSFDSAQTPSWAATDAENATRLKFNQIAFNVTYKDQTTNWGLGNKIGFDHPIRGLERRAVVARVLEYLGDVLNETAPAECDIVFEISETDGAGFLATAGPLFFDTPHGFRSGLAFQHITTGIDPAPGSADIVCTVDFGYPWYTDASPQTPASRFDLFTALLHELTHGLGLLSVADADGASLLTGGSPGVYTRWDQMMATPAGNPVFEASTRLVGPFENFLGAGGGIVLAGGFIRGVFGGAGPPIYTPSDFIPGSSLSHLAPEVPGELLMKHALNPGTAIREHHDLEIAALQDIGYTKAARLGSPTATFLSSNFSIGETEGAAVITVVLSEPPGAGKVSSVRYDVQPGTATEGADYLRVTGRLEFGAFADRNSFHVPIVEDNFRELNETILLKLSEPAGLVLPAENSEATLTIIDDDPYPLAQFNTPFLAVSEGAGVAQVQVILNVPSPLPNASLVCTSHPGSASSDDFTAVSGPFAFAPSQTTLTIDVSIADDTHHEPAEYFTLALSAPAGVVLSPPTQIMVVHIVDDDIDSDGDGLSDTDELNGIFGYVTDPHSADTDHDLISDFDEINGFRGFFTNPTLTDTDGDGVADGLEIYAGSDPTDPAQVPSVPSISVPRFSISGPKP